MEPPDFFLEMVGRHPHIPAHPTSARATGATPSPSPHPDTTPISPHIDEDALEGVYFAFSLILRCLPYFLRKTRPRASYELLEAFLPSLTADGASGASVGQLGRPIPLTTPDTTPSHPHIDEDALEGLYFAFSTILRCLPYFCRKTRPRASYGLLEAFSSSLTADGVGRVRPSQSRAHMGAWKPESRSIYHTRAGNPNPGWGSPGRCFSSISPRQSQSSPPHPQPALSGPPPSSARRPTRPTPTRPTPTRPTPTRPTPTRPTPNEKKN